ncbi:MAG: DUF1573 domain-containing protein [Clostridiaceae bacterium]
MKDIIVDDFQNAVGDSLLRHKSIIDIITKLQESNSKINRAVAKSITNCGCVSVEANKQLYKNDENVDIEEIRNQLDNHIRGHLCNNCQEIIEQEIGRNLFYIAALCNVLDLNMFDILITENEKLTTLGKYNLR